MAVTAYGVPWPCQHAHLMSFVIFMHLAILAMSLCHDLNSFIPTCICTFAISRTMYKPLCAMSVSKLSGTLHRSFSMQIMLQRLGIAP